MGGNISKQLVSAASLGRCFIAVQLATACNSMLLDLEQSVRARVNTIIHEAAHNEKERTSEQARARARERERERERERGTELSFPLLLSLFAVSLSFLCTKAMV